MKTLISFFSVAAILVLASSFTVDVQEKSINDDNQCFNFIRGHRQGNGAAISWGSSANDVNGFVVERSYDDYMWEPAGSAAGGSGSYRVKDESVFPGIVYYRVMANKSDGSTELSPTITVRIVQKH